MRSNTVIARPNDYLPMRFTHHTTKIVSKKVRDRETGARLKRRVTTVKVDSSHIQRDFVPSLSTRKAIELYDARVTAGLTVAPPNATPHPFKESIGDTSYAGTRAFKHSLALDSWSMKATKRGTNRVEVERVPITTGSKVPSLKTIKALTELSTRFARTSATVAVPATAVKAAALKAAIAQRTIQQSIAMKAAAAAEQAARESRWRL